MLIVPKKNHRFVDALCSKIVPNTVPIRVPVSPDRKAQLNECFFNVRKKMEREGGNILHGWCLWEFPGLFIEAEFHSLWIAPNGGLLDITPKQDGESEILFLPDPSAVFDEAAYNRRDNVRLAIKDHPIVHEFLKCAEERIRLLSSSTDRCNPRLSDTDEATHDEIFERMSGLQISMFSLLIEKKDMCPCGSAENYEDCCEGK